MPLSDRMAALTEAFYDAALDETLWPSALKGLMDFTRSQAASFWVLDRSPGPRLPTFVYLNFDPTVIEQYVGWVAPLDPTVRHLIAHPEQSIVHDGLLGSGRDEDSRAYADWHVRSVETRFRMVGQSRLAPEAQGGVALHRTNKAGRFEPADIECFAVLHRHLQRALAIAVRLASLGAIQRFNAKWLERNGSGIVLLDQHGRIIFANSRAHTFHVQGDGIRFSTEGIVLARKAEQSRLRKLIAKALNPDKGEPTPSDSMMRVSRPSGKRSYALSVMPVSKQSPVLALSHPRVCIVVADPDQQAVPRPEALQECFDLTPAEARLAVLLANGGDLRAAAQELGITYGTARARLTQLFGKTGTGRQGELVSLLLRTLAR